MRNPEAEALIGREFPYLDHGFVQLADYMGTDTCVTQAARTSYGKGTKVLSNEENLIRYLMRHWHTTPFEMCELKFILKMPIFVARQHIRHRTANVNEYSARYSILASEFYIPKPEHLARQSTTNKQGRGAVLSEEEAARVRSILFEDSAKCYNDYQTMIDEDGLDLSRELARMNLPTNIYTKMVWKMDLHNLFHYLRLRTDSHAQYEIRAMAELIDDIVRQCFPICHRAFVDYRRDAISFSKQEQKALQEVLEGTTIQNAAINTLLTVREQTEFVNKMMKITEPF